VFAYLVVVTLGQHIQHVQPEFALALLILRDQVALDVAEAVAHDDVFLLDLLFAEDVGHTVGDIFAKFFFGRHHLGETGHQKLTVVLSELVADVGEVDEGIAQHLVVGVTRLVQECNHDAVLVFLGCAVVRRNNEHVDQVSSFLLSNVFVDFLLGVSFFDHCI